MSLQEAYTYTLIIPHHGWLLRHQSDHKATMNHVIRQLAVMSIRLFSGKLTTQTKG